jgi:DNA (cytosine-5)-methyltransferase 1
MLTVGSLFSGIGGFDLGLERAGMRVIWQSEIDPYASAVLRKHWPTVPNLGDVRGITAASVADATGCGPLESVDTDQRGTGMGKVESTRDSSGPTDLICGGFPCQDISNAGKRAGIDGERSGLWSEFARIIGELRPRYVIVENVAALLGRGIERVLGDLAALGFDAEWHCIPASAVGAPHRRDRVWIVAYAVSNGCERFSGGRDIGRAAVNDSWREITGTSVAGNVSDADRSRTASGRDDSRVGRYWESLSGRTWRDDVSWWGAEPDLGRVAHGIPRRVDRLRCLGNSIVPQIAEIIGRAIIESEGLT